jgi:hypothetical protein
MAMKYVRAYRENSVSVVGHANGTIPLTRSTKHVCFYNVGYLSSGFEYFLSGFAYELTPIKPTPVPSRTR